MGANLGLFEFYCRAYTMYTGISLPTFKPSAQKDFLEFVNTFAYKFGVPFYELNECVTFCYTQNPLNLELKQYGVAENFVKSFPHYKRYKSTYGDKLMELQAQTKVIMELDEDFKNG